MQFLSNYKSSGWMDSHIQRDQHFEISLKDLYRPDQLSNYFSLHAGAESKNCMDD